MGTIAIPERQFLADVIFQKKTNPDLPLLGHTILFHTADCLSANYGGIVDIPAVQPVGFTATNVDAFELETLSSTRSSPLFGVSSDDAKVVKNEGLMKHTTEFETLIRYGDNV